MWLDRPVPFRVYFDDQVKTYHEDAYRMGSKSTLLPLLRALEAIAEDPYAVGGEEISSETGFHWDDVDFVTDRNNLRKLLRWVREAGPSPIVLPSDSSPPPVTTAPSAAPENLWSPEATKADALWDSRDTSAPTVTEAKWDERKDFRIDIQLGGAKTVLMHRWAPSAREYVEPPKGGCRANFERESTEAALGCEKGAGHFRIVKYVSTAASTYHECAI